MSKTEDDEKELQAFFSNERLYLVFTNAGKPVYSSYGDIYQLSPIIATLYAILSKVHTFEFPEYENPLNAAIPELAKLTQEELDVGEKIMQSSQKLSSRLSFAFKSMIKDKHPASQASSESNSSNHQQEESSVQKETVTPQDPTRTGFENVQDDVKTTKVCQIATRSRDFKVAFLQKGSSLIYIALTKIQSESITFLKKQLQMLHAQLISLNTYSLIKTLTYNQSYDVANDLFEHHYSIKYLCDRMHQDPFTFLNQFLPLRLHPKTREVIEEILLKNKPKTDKFYFGLILMDSTVVGVIKNEMKITVVPTVNLFIHLEQESALKIIFASDENTPDLRQEFDMLCMAIKRDFEELEILDILQICEQKMSEKQNLKEVQNIIISHQSFEQYTTYNYPITDPSQLNKYHLRSIQEYEQLYDRYQAFTITSKSKDFYCKKVHSIETYVILAQGDYCVMATMHHNDRINNVRDIREICQNILDDAKLEEDSSFIPNWF
eukprot:403341817